MLNDDLAIGYIRASLVAQMVESLPAMQETRVQSMGREDPLKKGMATQYPFLENCMGRGAWWALAHGVANRQTQLSG